MPAIVLPLSLCLSFSLCIHCNKTELQCCNCNCFRFANCPRRFLQCRRRRRRRCLLAWDMACVSRIATTYKKFINGAAARHGPDCSQTYARRTDRGETVAVAEAEGEGGDRRTGPTRGRIQIIRRGRRRNSLQLQPVSLDEVCVPLCVCLCVFVCDCLCACLAAWLCSPVVSSRYRYNCSLQILLQPQTDALPLPLHLPFSLSLYLFLFLKIVAAVALHVLIAAPQEAWQLWLRAQTRVTRRRFIAFDCQCAVKFWLNRSDYVDIYRSISCIGI